MKPRVLLDMDGVVYDWNSGACRLVGIDCTNAAYRSVLVESENALDRLVPKKKLIQAVAEAGVDFWQKLPLLPWGRELHDRLALVGDLCFLTSYGHWTDAPKGKLLALQRDFPDTPVLFGRKKRFCAGPRSVLIDDKFENVDEFRQAGGMAVEWPNQYLIEDKAIDIHRVMDELIALIEQGIIYQGDE